MSIGHFLPYKSSCENAMFYTLTLVARQKLSLLDRGTAMGWINNGLSLREISRRLQVSVSVISRLRQRFLATGGFEERPRTGRPRATTAREDRFITRQAQAMRTATAQTIRRQLRNATHTSISTQTVRWEHVQITPFCVLVCLCVCAFIFCVLQCSCVI